MDLKDHQDISQIIEGCINGQRKFQEILHKAFYSKMLVVCMRYSENKAEAEDLLHDGFIKLYQKLEKYNHQGSFEGWIRRIFVNNSIDYLRRKKEFTLRSEDDSHMIFEERKDDSIEELDQIKITEFKAQQVLDAIQKLSPAYKAVFNMYVLDEMSHKEIAEQLGISIGTSKSNLSKAKIKIRALLSEQF